MVPIDSIQANSHVDVSDSCNGCCVGCFARPTRAERASSIHERAEHVEQVLKGHVMVSPTEIKVFSTIEPVKREDGTWELTLERQIVDDGLRPQQIAPKKSIFDSRKKV